MAPDFIPEDKIKSTKSHLNITDIKIISNKDRVNISGIRIVYISEFRRK